MPPKEQQPMPPAPNPAPADKRREIHRAQVNLVQASLRAGVRYQRPGRVAKAPPKRV
jgi:DNA-binding helix-hairpin-helix protein with protein kinase domain